MASLVEQRLVGVLRWLIWPIIAFNVSACAALPDLDALTVKHGIVEPYQTVPIITATDRRQDTTGIGYTAERSPRLRFERFTVAPSRSIIGSGNENLDALSESIEKYIVTKREDIKLRDIHSSRDILIYVHGYNYSFEESLFQFARIVTEGGLTEAPILFSWPSEGAITGYVADKEAAVYARDDLVDLLSGLKKQNPKSHVTLFGHSMGAWIVVESLRQLKLSKRNDVLRWMSRVVLAAPDIDIDLFKRQIETIGPLAHPMIVLNSRDDRALAISRRVGGFRVRMGSVDTDNAIAQEMIAQRAIQVIDLSMLPAPDGTNHNRFIKLVGVLSRSNQRRKTFLENGIHDALFHVGITKGPID